MIVYDTASFIHSLVGYPLDSGRQASAKKRNNLSTMRGQVLVSINDGGSPGGGDSGASP